MARPKTKRGPNFSRDVQRLLKRNPLVTKKAMAAHLGFGYETFQRFWREDEESGAPRGLPVLVEEARRASIEQVDNAMLVAAVTDRDTAAAKLIYQRADAFEEREARNAKQGAPTLNFQFNVSAPSAETVNLVQGIRGEIERDQREELPGHKLDTERFLPGSTIFRAPDDAAASEPGDPERADEYSEPAEKRPRAIIDRTGRG